MTSKEEAQRFGGEFGPYRSGETKGVSLSTFKTLVWTSNIGGLVLVAISLEMFITQRWFWGIICLVTGIVIALFPSNYEIVGMEQKQDQSDESQDEP